MASLLALIPLLLEFLKVITTGMGWWIKLTDEQRKAVTLAFKELHEADDSIKPGSVRHAVNRFNATL